MPPFFAAACEIVLGLLPIVGKLWKLKVFFARKWLDIIYNSVEVCVFQLIWANITFMIIGL